MGGGAAVGRRQEGYGQGGIGSGSRKGDTVAAVDEYLGVGRDGRRG